MTSDVAIEFDESGLVPAVVQDSTTGHVLMLGYMNREAIDLTIDTGDVHFWSRSRSEIWRKGSTSGNVLSDARISIDCDGDALLVTAAPSGPTCHSGSESCFGPGNAGIDPQLATLAKVISNRLDEQPAGSYTAELAQGGVPAVGRKLVEEATEVLLAALDVEERSDKDRVGDEAADLLYHLLVLLELKDVPLADVAKVLKERSG